MKTAILAAIVALAVVVLVGAGAVRSSGVFAKTVPGTTAHPATDHEAKADAPGADAGLNHEFNSTHDGDFVNETGEW